MRSSDSPAAPKLPSIPARLIASTISDRADAVGHRAGHVRVLEAVIAKERGVAELLGRSGGKYATTGSARAGREPTVMLPPFATANPVSARTIATGRPEIGQGGTKIGRRSRPESGRAEPSNRIMGWAARS